jgi:drug/metabolite transporter (DMT)-like permease
MKTTLIILAPLLPLLLSLVAGWSRKTRMKKVAFAAGVLGVVLYVGGWTTGMIGDRINPGVDSFCWGKTSTCGILIMLAGVPVAVVAGILTLIVFGMDIGRKLKRGEPQGGGYSPSAARPLKPTP